ncbi:hypothetical protein FSP39_018238 [Pinctada imbricata]|uniref:Peroxidase n=1 Tax=Pinctada imbricata TaxID=66713 RepID=A0AA89C1P9_PINIB|nr:hypothetical protein FSP39_018238 [Pinctada imbricata]
MRSVSWLLLILSWFAIINGGIGRQKRHISFSGIFQQVKNVIDETNKELAHRKEIDRIMLEQGVDGALGAASSTFASHLTRFLYTKNQEKVDLLSDKAWITVQATKKLISLTGMSLDELKLHPGYLEAWRRQVAQSCPFNVPSCDPTVRFRTPDGSCNNLNDSSVGAAYTRQRRMMDNAYDDGIDLPRKISLTGYPLPSSRLISNMVHKTDGCSLPSEDFTVMTMQFGQFIEHDVISTPLQRDVRSPMNQATSYLDASQVYGVDVDEQLKLRAGVGGLMKITPLGLPPPSDEPICVQENPGDYCMATGDFRVNHVPGLTVMHTLFLRQHNRLATGLHLINAKWDDERVFQETRKIIIAIEQHIVYNHLLPTILNNEYMTKYGLWSERNGHSMSYESDEDVSIMMGFSGAAMRFPHTRIPDVQSRVNFNYKRRQDAPIFSTFDKPKFVLENYGRAMDDFARWLVSFPAMKDDRFVVDGVRDHLFRDERGESFDLIALNIQRAREQGIPPYNHWRRLCGFQPARFFTVGPGGFTDIPVDVVKKYAMLYK